jgi:hypothetical protein
VPLGPQAQATGRIAGAGATVFYQLTLTQSGRLAAQLRPAGFGARLSLFDAQGSLLVQSDGIAPADTAPLIVQDLAGQAGGTTYYLEVQGLGGGSGDFTLTTAFLPAVLPFQPIPVGKDPVALVTGDFNGDGHADLVSVNEGSGDISVLLGLGDGTFRPLPPMHVGTLLGAAAVGDFNGDGHLDLALTVAENGTDGVAVLLGNGDGTFQAPHMYATGSLPVALVAGDFTQDGHLDLATADSGSGTVSILLGRGNGQFQEAPPVRLGGHLIALTAGEFNGDGNLDLAAVDDASHSVVLLQGNGDGTFQAPTSFIAGSKPVALLAGDFTGDGRLDFAVADRATSEVAVYRGGPGGTFDTQDPLVTKVDGRAVALVEGDFNGDGRLDLAVLSDPSVLPGISVLLGNGDGTFQNLGQFTEAEAPTALVSGDFNGDGHLDLATAQSANGDVRVLLGLGDGTFPPSGRFPTGGNPTAVVVGDFNRDGRTDLATANFFTSDISVLRGVGDGTLAPQTRYALPGQPVALVSGDFNRDGRTDLAAAVQSTNSSPAAVVLLLGLGDGTFREQGQVVLPGEPISLLAGDFNGDGIVDLAVGLSISTRNQAGPQFEIAVFLGKGDGTFAAAGVIPVAKKPKAMVAGDFNRDGRLDLAIANIDSGDVSILLGLGDGQFREAQTVPVGTGPSAIVTGDFNGDGIPDLAVADENSNEVTVLTGTGDGTFQRRGAYPVGSLPLGLVAADFGDGRLGLVATDAGSGQISVLRGQGDGTFIAGGTFTVGKDPRAIGVGNFNGDGAPDLAVADFGSSDVSILVGVGDGTFFDAGQAANAVQATPLVADFSGDRVPDVAELRPDGRILLRRGRADELGVFDPPFLVNPPVPVRSGSPARDLAVVPRAGGGADLAALDATDPFISLYSFDAAKGSFVLTARLSVPGLLPARIVSGDLGGNGRADLVVTAAGSNQVFVYLQNADGSFNLDPTYRLDVGISPLAVTLANVNGDGRPDIVVTNQFSGDVSVLLNDPVHPFATEERFRAGTGLYGLGKPIETDPNPTVQSPEETVAVTAGRFSRGTAEDLVVLNRGLRTASVLVADGSGGLLNPQAALTFPAGLDPTAVVAGRFGPGLNLDLAVLDAGRQQVMIYSGDGSGSFAETGMISAGNAPTGLALADVTRPGGGPPDGIPDLLIGNEFGDVLVLPGKGDGTFEPFQRLDAHIALAVADLTGNGRDDFIYANQALDRVSVQYGSAPPSRLSDPNHSILGPGVVKLADMNGDGIPDLIVANTGSNNVLVYPGLGNGQFGPEVNGGKGFAVGTNPVGVTVADVNGDGSPDLVVANEGSNDVSVLLGQGRGADWTLTPGPRLEAGLGPVATVVQDVTGNGIPDILVTNSESNTVTLLPGVGGGFFNDQNPRTIPVGTTPVQALVGDFTGAGQVELVTVNRGSNSLTIVSNFTNPAAAVEFSISSGGDSPVAAVAVDAHHDGLEDLIVANNGDGVVSLVLGEVTGLPVLERLPVDLPHAADLAEVSDAAGVRVYGVGDASETATLLFTFGIGIPPPGLQLLPPVGPSPALVAQPVALENSAFPVVVIVLTGSDLGTGLVPSAAAEAPLAVAADAATVSVAAARPGEAVFDPGNGTSEWGADGPAPPADGDLSGTPDLLRLVIGLEEALQRSRQDARDDLFPGPLPLPVGEPQGALDALFSTGLALAAGEVDGVSRVLSSSGAVALQDIASARDMVLAAVGLREEALPDVGVGTLLEHLSRALREARRSDAAPDGSSNLASATRPEALPLADSFAAAGFVAGLWHARRGSGRALTEERRKKRGRRGGGPLGAGAVVPIDG